MVVTSRSKTSAKKKLVSRVVQLKVKPELKNWVFLKITQKEVETNQELKDWFTNHEPGTLYESQIGKSSLLENLKGKVGALIR